MDPQALSRIERTNYLLGAVLVAVVAIAGSTEQALGAAVGAALSAVNFSIVRRIVERILAAPSGDKSRPALAFIPKMTGLMVAVALALYFLPLSAVMLAVGFSIFLISIAVETVRFVSRPRGGAGGAGTDHG
jgi:hypothetical protein